MLEKKEQIISEENSTAQENSYPFGSDFQARIAALSMRDNQFLRRTDGLILPDYFSNIFEATLVDLAQDHFKKYKSAPSLASWKQIVQDAVSSKKIRADETSEFIDTFKRLYKEDLSDRDFVVDKVADFAKSQAVQNAFIKAFDLTEKGKMIEAQALMEEAFSVGAADQFEDHSYWNDIDIRTKYRKDIAAGVIKPNGVPTGIKLIDNYLYHKGLGRKELTAIMGGAKKGKSMMLGELCLRISKKGYNVLYVTLEVSAQIIMDRMDANISDTEMDNIATNINKVDTEVKSKRVNVGNLKVVEFPSGTLTPSALRRIIERYRADGIIFDVICVDYADIMAPDFRTGIPTEDSKSIWLALRAIAHEQNAAGLTATQTNREGYQASVAKSEHVADDFNKVRIADLLISINRDEDELKAGIARLYLAASRNQGAEVTFKIEQDLAKMVFIKGITYA